MSAKALSEVDDAQTTEFMHALAASDVDARNISAGRSEFSGMNVEVWVPVDDDGRYDKRVNEIAEQHGFYPDGALGGGVIDGQQYSSELFIEY